MKVILKKDVAKLGKKNDIKDVPEGYARNFLLRNNLAEIATVVAIKALSRLQNTKRIEKEIGKNLLQKNMRELEGLEITLLANANDKGILFKSIHAQEIADELKKEHRIDIDPQSIILTTPIKALGEYTIEVAVFDEKAKFILRVEASKKHRI